MLIKRSGSRAALLLGTALTALAYADGAFAQAANTGSAPGAQALEEVVVTATRQTDTVNRVPLSITAETQKSLDQQGIKSIGDLQATVPALQTYQLTPGVAQVSIRGINNANVGLAAAAGAPTTGFYLDDTPIQKRSVGGGVATNNGTPLPPLFDLERVEVLRGPQGTLYGGSSEGGTVRYITPQPSLTRYSAYARAEVSSTKDGQTSYEGGLAVGGPIIQDKLGFRASIFDRHYGGYLDYVNVNNPNQVDIKDANSRDVRLFRGAITWAMTDRARLTFSYLNSYDRSKDINQGYQESIPQINAGAVCYNTTGLRPGSTALFPGGTPCNAAAPPAGTTYVRPGYTYGPYQLGPYRTLDISGPSPAKTNLQIPALTIDYDFGPMTFKSITSYIYDSTKSVTPDTVSLVGATTANATVGSTPVPVFGLPFLGPAYPYPDLGAGNGHFYGENLRHGFSQEFRFASAGDARPFSWVAGAFYSNTRGDAVYEMYYDLNRESLAAYGLTAFQRFGSNAFLTSAGVLNGFLLPTTANGGLAGGSTAESPISPKFGLQYQLTDRDMLYLTASKGYRAGGINTLLPLAICGPALGLHGLQPTDIPGTYKSDTVWSYEAGGKFRLFNNAVQLNGDVYRIDWNNVQLTRTAGAGCGIPFTVNAGNARSQGFELEGQARPFAGLTLNGAVAYTDAYYTQDAVGVSGGPGTTPIIVATKGQHFETPPWSISVGARYDWRLSAMTNLYARADYRWAAKFSYVGTQIPSNNDYSPDWRYADANNLNLRVGVEYGDFDINAFINNVTDYHKGLTTGGRSGCIDGASCSVYAFYSPLYNVQPFSPPRQIGLQIAYRH